jgi:hypothetical protein
MLCHSLADESLLEWQKKIAARAHLAASCLTKQSSNRCGSNRILFHQVKQRAPVHFTGPHPSPNGNYGRKLACTHLGSAPCGFLPFLVHSACDRIEPTPAAGDLASVGTLPHCVCASGRATRKGICTALGLDYKNLVSALSRVALKNLIFLCARANTGDRGVQVRRVWASRVTWRACRPPPTGTCGL